LDVLTGPAQVVQIPDEVGIISAQALEKAAVPAGTERLLLKTRNSQRWARGEKTFDLEFLAISEDGAKWLVQQGIKLIGIDYLSIAPYKEGGPTHRALLEVGIVILEGLDLSTISPGEYELYCLPLKLVGSDGAPARTILVK
jgi:arylformamidase